jgi:hypothetical protein
MGKLPLSAPDNVGSYKVRTNSVLAEARKSPARTEEINGQVDENALNVTGLH